MLGNPEPEEAEIFCPTRQRDRALEGDAGILPSQKHLNSASLKSAVVRGSKPDREPGGMIEFQSVALGFEPL